MMRATFVCLMVGVLIVALSFGVGDASPAGSDKSATASANEQGVCRKGYKQVLGRATSCRYTCSAGDIGAGADFYTGEMPNGHKCRQPGRFWGTCKEGRCVPTEGDTTSE